MSELRNKATSAFIWDFTGKLLTHGTGFVFAIVLARLLQPYDFGLIAIGLVIIGVVGIFSDLGLGPALIQRRQVLSAHYSSVFYFSIGIGLLLTVLTFLSAPLIARFYENERLTLIVQVMSILFVINAFGMVHAIKLRKDLNFSLLTKSRFMASFISGLIGVILAIYGVGVWSLVAQAIGQALCFNIIIWFNSHWKPSLEFSFNAIMELWVFGFRIFLSGLLDALVSSLDTLIIGKLFTPATLGYYEYAKKLEKFIIFTSSGSLVSVLFPLLSKVQHDIYRFQSIVTKSLGVIIFTTFMLLGGLYLVSEEIILLLLGSKWMTTLEYFKILVLSGFGYPISALLVNILSSRGKSKEYLRLEIYKAIIFVTNIVVGFMWGIEGYLYGLILATSLAVYLNILYASRETGIPQNKLLMPVIVQSVVTVLTVLIVTIVTKSIDYHIISMLIIKGTLFSILYVLGNRILKIDSYRYFTEYTSLVLNAMLKR